MAKKKQIEDKLEEFKNISNDKTVVYAAEIKKEKEQAKIQDKIKEEKEKYTSKVEEKQNEVEVVKEDKIKEETKTTEIETIDELVQTIDTLTDTIEEKVVTIEEKVEEKEKTPSTQVYDMKRMFGYDWMGVVYDE